MSQDIYTCSVQIPLGAGTVSAGTSNVLAMALPGTSYGGGITIRRWFYGSNRAVAVGSAPSVNLITQTSTGGTIGTICTNGSVALNAGTPVTGSITTAYIPGTVAFLSVQFGHENLAASSTLMTVAIQYNMGRGSA